MAQRRVKFHVVKPNMIASHVMDLEQTLALGASRSVSSGDEAEALESDVVVTCASAPLRLEAVINFSALRHFPLERVGFMKSSTHISVKYFSDFYISYRNSLRLRTGISRVLDVAPQSIDTRVVGEHGDSCVPLFSRVKVAGEPVELTAEERRKAEEFMRSWYARHVALDSGRSSTQL